MTFKSVTGIPVEVRSLQVYQTRQGCPLVLLEIVPRDGTVSKIVLSIKDVKFLADSFRELLSLIKELPESQ